jgi:hypothetical protein
MMLTVVTLPWRSLYEMEVMRMLTAVNALASCSSWAGPGLSSSTSWAGLGWAGLGWAGLGWARRGGEGNGKGSGH